MRAGRFIKPVEDYNAFIPPPSPPDPPMALPFEIDAAGKKPPKNVAEVVNCTNAMNYGLERIAQLPLYPR